MGGGEPTYIGLVNFEIAFYNGPQGVAVQLITFESNQVLFLPGNKAIENENLF